MWICQFKQVKLKGILQRIILLYRTDFAEGFLWIIADNHVNRDYALSPDEPGRGSLHVLVNTLKPCFDVLFLVALFVAAVDG